MPPRNKVAKKKAKAPLPAVKRKTNKSMILAFAIIAVVIVAFSALVITGHLNQPEMTTDHYANAKEVLLQTSMGNITVALRNDKPITTTNFLNIVYAGEYDNTVFHRIIAGFMIQGGQLNGVNVANIQDEIGTDNHNYNGTIAMANTNAANSASSQFFINVADNNNRYSSFDTTYTVFGKVVSGMDVVMAISNVPTDTNDAPLQTVTLISATVLP